MVEVSLAMVYDAVKAMPLASTPGLDHKTFFMFCTNLFIHAPWLPLISSIALSLQCFLYTWRVVKIILLRKLGKASYSMLCSYDLINLFSHLGKGLERTVNCWLMHNLGGASAIATL